MDCLTKYKMNDEDKERVLMKVLKRIGCFISWPKYIERRINFKTWSWIDDRYGEGCSADATRLLADLGLLESSGPESPYRISKKGKEYKKRGYVLRYIDRTAERANTIAIIALVVAGLAFAWDIIRYVIL